MRKDTIFSLGGTVIIVMEPQESQEEAPQKVNLQDFRQNVLT